MGPQAAGTDEVITLYNALEKKKNLPTRKTVMKMLGTAKTPR